MTTIKCILVFFKLALNAWALPNDTDWTEKICLDSTIIFKVGVVMLETISWMYICIIIVIKNIRTLGLGFALSCWGHLCLFSNHSFCISFLDKDKKPTFFQGRQELKRDMYSYITTRANVGSEIASNFLSKAVYLKIRWLRYCKFPACQVNVNSTSVR